jgi:flagellar protein FlbT
VRAGEIGEADPEEARKQLMTGIDQLSAVFDDAESTAALDSAASHTLNKRFYPALRALRSLLPREAQLMAAAQP